VVLGNRIFCLGIKRRLRSLFKFIHCADLHLDSPLHGLSAKSDVLARDIRSASRRALANLVKVAIDEKVAFVVIAGDVYDGDWPDYRTGLYFNSCMAQLGEAGILVFKVSGNHDAASQISRHLVLPDNVKAFSVDHAETYYIEALNVAIHGQGFKERAVTANLVPGYPPPTPGAINIGVLHTSVEGQGGHENYAPCRLSDLTEKGYDYWALGHIHKAGILHRNPFVVYSGNLQGRHVGETGAKGAMLVSCDAGQFTLEFVPLDVIRWFRCQVDLGKVVEDRDLMTQVARSVAKVADENPSIPLAVRLELSGATPLHGKFLAQSEYYRSEIENAATLVAPGRLWLEKIEYKTTPLLESSVPPQLSSDALVTLRQTMARLMDDEAFLQAFSQHAASLAIRLGAYGSREDASLIQSADDVRQLLPDAEALLSALIYQGGGEAQ